MKLSEYIEGLQKFLDNHGDLECYYASDDEGNHYQKVNWNGTLMYIEVGEEDSYQVNLYCEEDVTDEEIQEDEVTSVCVVN